MKNFFVALLAVLVFTGCDIRGRILLVGDSNMAFSAGAYTSVLYSGWTLGGYVPGYLPTNIGVPGMGLRDVTPLSIAVGKVNKAQKFDATVVNIGGNDCLKTPRFPGDSLFQVSAADYDARLDLLFASLPAGPVVLIDVPYFGHPSYSDSCAVQVNLALQRATNRHRARGVRYINVNTILARYPANQRYVDGLHFKQNVAEDIARNVVVQLDSLKF